MLECGAYGFKKCGVKMDRLTPKGHINPEIYFIADKSKLVEAINKLSRDEDVELSPEQINEIRTEYGNLIKEVSNLARESIIREKTLAKLEEEVALQVTARMMEFNVCNFLQEKIEKGMSVREIGRLTGVSAGTVSRISRGVIVPEISTMRKLVTPFGYRLKIVCEEDKNEH